MSIKPIDYINVISKSQEVSRAKHVENEKTNIHFQQGIVQQQKHVKEELRKVQKSNKSEYKIIDKYGRNKEDKNNDSNKKFNKKKDEKEGNTKGNTSIGITIDIKI